MEGFLSIKRKRFWVKRYVVVTNSGLLFYKKTKDSQKKKIVINLKDIDLKRSKRANGELYVSIMNTKTREEELRISFPDNATYMRWVEAIRISKVPPTKHEDHTGSGINSTYSEDKMSSSASPYAMSPVSKRADESPFEKSQENFSNRSAKRETQKQGRQPEKEDDNLEKSHTMARAGLIKNKQWNFNGSKDGVLVYSDKIMLENEEPQGTSPIVYDTGIKQTEIFVIFAFAILTLSFEFFLRMPWFPKYLSAVTLFIFMIDIIKRRRNLKRNIQLKQPIQTKVSKKEEKDIHHKVIVVVNASRGEILKAYQSLENRHKWEKGLTAVQSIVKLSASALQYQLRFSNSKVSKASQNNVVTEDSLTILEEIDGANNYHLFDISYVKNKPFSTRITMYTSEKQSAEYIASFRDYINQQDGEVENHTTGTRGSLQMRLSKAKGSQKAGLESLLETGEIDFDLDKSQNDSLDDSDDLGRGQSNTFMSPELATINEEAENKASRMAQGRASNGRNAVEEEKKNDGGEDFYRGVENLPEDQREIILEAKEKMKYLESLCNSNDWKRSEAKNEVEVSTLKGEGDATCVKGEGEIPFEVSKVLEYIKDPDTAKDYDELYESGKEIHVYPFATGLYYRKFKGILFVSSRDFSMVIHTLELPNGVSKLVAFSYEHPSVPKVKNVVRANLIVGGWILRPSEKSPNKTHAVYIMQSDLCGSIPSNVKNAVSKKQGFTVNGVRKGMLKRYNNL